MEEKKKNRIPDEDIGFGPLYLALMTIFVMFVAIIVMGGSMAVVLFLVFNIY